MPVGTKATVKALHPDEVRALGAHVILANTYHLHFRPGSRRRSSGWAACTHSPDGTGRSSLTPVVSRSFLCATRSLRSTTTGSPFARSTTARRHASVPRTLQRSSVRSARTSRCVSTSACRPTASRDDLERAVSITTSWAARQAGAPRAPAQLRFGITQGGTDAELRRRSIEEITALPFDGYALGGLAVGESKEEMLDCVDWATPLLCRRQAAVLHGHRRSRRHPRGDRARGGHVRLRAADANGEDRLCARVARTPQHAERPVTSTIPGRSTRNAAARHASGSRAPTSGIS